MIVPVLDIIGPGDLIVGRAGSLNQADRFALAVSSGSDSELARAILGRDGEDGSGGLVLVDRAGGPIPAADLEGVVTGKG